MFNDDDEFLKWVPDPYIDIFNFSLYTKQKKLKILLYCSGGGYFRHLIKRNSRIFFSNPFIFVSLPHSKMPKVEGSYAVEVEFIDDYSLTPIKISPIELNLKKFAEYVPSYVQIYHRKLHMN